MHKHTKHTRLVKRQTETYAPNEIAILGANCNVISNLVSAISNLLKNYKLAYLDASHAKDVQPISVSEYTFHHQGNVQISKAQPLNTYQQQLEFATYDFVFINGNHYTGKKQILILDPNKKASVLKRLEQLDNIQFVVKLDNSTPFFEFLEAKYPNISQKKCYHITNIVGIANHIHTLIKEKMAPIKGLVMAGGNSMRMGTDKTTLNYYNVPQKEYVKTLLEAHNLETYYSVKTAKNTTDIADVFYNLGPFGGICSAFLKDPNAAWLVLATDLPFVTKDLIHLLLQHRDPSKVATAIKGKNKPFVEPLITIYEPKAYGILLQFLAQGYSCPRKMLINNAVNIIEVDDALIRNINTPEEFKIAMAEINANKNKK